MLVAFSALFNPPAAWLFMLRIFLYISHSGMSVDVGLDVWRKKYTNGYSEQTFKLRGGKSVHSLSGCEREFPAKVVNLSILIVCCIFSVLH